MSKILVIGGTGFAGAFIVKEAARRGHTVTVLSRSVPSEPIQNVTYVQGSALDAALRAPLIASAAVVIAAVSPRGDMTGKVKDLYLDIAKEAAEHSARFIIVGGFSSLRAAPNEPRFFENGSVPPEYLDEAIEIASVFDSLKAHTPDNLHWVFISPASVFGAYATVPDSGNYRAGNDIALFDDNNESKISGADFAIGVVDEVENSTHDHENISFVH